MSVVVTGGAGYVGSHVVLELLDVGEKVTVLDDLSTGFECAVPKDATFVRGDIGDANLVARTLKQSDADAIVHFAGSVVVPDSVRDPLRYYLDNSCKSRTLIECAIKANVKHFIFSSTAAVYGIPEANPATEQRATRPISPYGRSKLVTGMMLSDASSAFDLSYVVLRYFNVAGADPSGRAEPLNTHATNLIRIAVQTALRYRPHLEVYGADYPTPDGTCIRDYVHVNDVASAHTMALAYLRNGGSSQVLNCGYGRGYSVLDVISSVRGAAAVDFPVRVGPRRVGDVAALVADPSRIRKVFDWRPKFCEFDTIVGHALQWERRLAKSCIQRAAC